MLSNADSPEMSHLVYHWLHSLRLVGATELDLLRKAQ